MNVKYSNKTQVLLNLIENFRRAVADRAKVADWSNHDMKRMDAAFGKREIHLRIDIRIA